MKPIFLRIISIMVILVLSLPATSQDNTAQLDYLGDSVEPLFADLEWSQIGQQGRSDPPQPLDWPGSVLNRPELYKSPEKISNVDNMSHEERSDPDIVKETQNFYSEFLYRWDYIDHAWIDASNGTDTGMLGDGYDQATGPINLPFPFKYYEKTYAKVYIAAAGYLSFEDTAVWYDQGDMPSFKVPNSVIAPLWTPTYISSSSWVRYLSGGTAPNRYFLVEWHDLMGGPPGDIGANELYRFEVILYENGNMDFQYHTIFRTGSYWTSTSGIEDPQGLDGLPISTSVYQGIRFSRPAPAGRVRVRPLDNGSFIYKEGWATFKVDIQNIGDLGTDTFDLEPQNFTWPEYIYSADGATLLTDTDGDGFIDTGPVQQGATTSIIIKIQASEYAQSGTIFGAYINVSPSLPHVTGSSIKITLAVPSQFTQFFNSNKVDFRNSLQLNQPGGQVVKPVTREGQGGYDLAVTETAQGDFFTAWSKGRCVDSDCNIQIEEIYYSLVNQYGETIRTPTRIVDLRSVSTHTYDYLPVVAATPDGNIGVAWVRELTQYVFDHWEYNYNIYFAIFDPSGNKIFGPQNLTQNFSWFSPIYAPEVPLYYYPQITGTTDNRFLLAWYREQRAPGCTSYDCWYEDIYYTVISSMGNQVRNITQATFDTIGSSYDYSYYPSLAKLAGNRALIMWYRYSTGDILARVLDSNGNPLTEVMNLSYGYTYDADLQSDAAQFLDGRILVAWTSSDGDTYQIRYTILDGSYNRMFEPRILDNDAEWTGAWGVSASADHNGDVVLTWMDYGFKQHLYYSVLTSSGWQKIPPMVFHTGAQPDPFIESNYLGYGNTTYSSNILSGADGALVMPNIQYPGEPGQAAVVPVRFSNHGQSIATGVSLTLTLGSGLTYVSDNSGVLPTIGSGTVTWSFPDLTFLEERKFELILGLPNDPVGTTYPISLNLSVNSEANPADNLYNSQVVASTTVYMPVVKR